jgi:hypothetical protein
MKKLNKNMSHRQSPESINLDNCKEAFKHAMFKYDNFQHGSDCDHCNKLVYVARSKYQTAILRAIAAGITIETLQYDAMPIELRTKFTERQWMAMNEADKINEFVECPRCAKRWKKMVEVYKEIKS